MWSTRLKRLLLLYSILPAVVSAQQQCYYPNGDLSKDDAPCSSQEGAACCPKDWQCLDNGLCYLDNQKYFGRYTCTDKSWQSNSCPNFCTNNSKDSGNQAVQQCSNHANQYCCDHNRDPSNYCCNQNDDTLFFALPNGKPTASIASLGGPADATASNNKEDSQPSTIQLGPPSVSLPPNPATSIINPATTIGRDTVSVSSTSPAPPPSPTTITKSSTQSAPNGQTSIILLTSIISTTPSPPSSSPPTAAAAATTTNQPHPSSSSSSSTAAAIGGGVGGGVAALLGLSALLFLLLRKRRRRQRREMQDATMKMPSKDGEAGMEYMYKNQGGGGGTPWTGSTVAEEGGSPEIDGREVGVVGKVGRESFVRPGERTRVDGGGRGEGEGLGLKAEEVNGRERVVSELPAEDVPRRGDGHGEGVMVQDKWKRYQMAAAAANGRR